MSQHHDPVHPDSGHLSPELLADLDEGLLDAESAAHAQAHLAHCEQCQTTHAALQEVSTALRDLPHVRMPDDVWQSLQQQLGSTPQESKVAQPAATTVVPLEVARSRRTSWAGRTFGGIAVAAGVLFVGALIVPNLLNTGGDDADAGPQAANDTSVDQTEAGSLTQYDVTRSGTQYQTARLDSQVTQLVAARSPGTSPPTEEGQTLDAITPTPSAMSSPPESSAAGDLSTRTSLLLSADAARVCLENYLYAPDLEPLAIDIGQWKGQSAAVVVLPVADNAGKIEVWVIDPACADNPAGDVTVWHYQRLDAP